MIALLLCTIPALGGLPNVPAVEAPRDGRPNIVFAFADDWGRHASCYAELEPGGVNDVLKTPNIDRVAREGVLFTRAFVSAPSCTPCRSSLLSGRHFWECGRASILLGAEWDYSIPSYPLLLEEVGYHIGYSYKVWGPGRPDDAPYGEKRTEYGEQRDRMNRFSQTVMQAVAEGRPAEEVKAEILAESRGHFAACIDDAAEKDQPFCYWFGPTNVHRKWIQGSGQTLWDIDPDALKGKMPPYLPDEPLVREDLADYFGEVLAFDAALGQLLAELEERGELDNTLLVVSGDHGAPGFPDGKCNLYDFGSGVPLMAMWPGECPPGRVVEDFVSLPDLTPTFLEVGDVAVPNGVSARSLLPLLRSEKSGQIDAARDAVFIGRERHVAEARPDSLPYPQRAIRTADFLLVRNFRPDRWPMGDPAGHNRPDEGFEPFEALREDTFVAFSDVDAGPTKAEIITRREEPAIAPHYQRMVGKRPEFELYDLRTDPHQQTNVADDPDYASTRDRLTGRLMQTLRRTEDPRVFQDGRYFETAPLIVPPRPRKK